MKKFLVGILLFLVVNICYAQYTVINISGRAELETKPNQWRLIEVGEVLQDSSVVRTGVNSWLSLETFIDGKPATVLIGPVSVGMIMDIIYLNNQTIRINGRITQTNIAPTARKTGQISTASARASDAAEDLEFIEE